MRYLSIAELEQINSLLSNVESDDGNRITGRLEAYSCKAAGADKKLLKRLEERFHMDKKISPEKSQDDMKDIFGSSPPPPLRSSAQQHEAAAAAATTAVAEGISLKLFYYLIATMNMIFPDYDFSDLKPETFQVRAGLQPVIDQVNATLFNAGVNKNVASFGEFSTSVWDRIDAAIGLQDCEIYSFQSDTLEADEDPFWERGCIWSFNYFFWNHKLKRILLFTCRAASMMRDSETFLAGDERLSQRSTTPMPTVP